MNSQILNNKVKEWIQLECNSYGVMLKQFYLRKGQKPSLRGMRDDRFNWEADKCRVYTSLCLITEGIFKNIMSKSVEKLQNENLLGDYICIEKEKNAIVFMGDNS